MKLIEAIEGKQVDNMHITFKKDKIEEKSNERVLPSRWEELPELRDGGFIENDSTINIMSESVGPTVPVVGLSGGLVSEAHRILEVLKDHPINEPTTVAIVGAGTYQCKVTHESGVRVLHLEAEGMNSIGALGGRMEILGTECKMAKADFKLLSIAMEDVDKKAKKQKPYKNKYAKKFHGKSRW